MDSALAKKALINGNILAFPTETVWGLGVDAASPEAIQALYTLKGRDKTLALQILVDSIAMAQGLVRWNSMAQRLAEASWPGGLTLVLPRHPQAPISPEAAQGKETLGLRFPDYAPVLAIITAFGAPIAATSANPSGQPPASSAQQVRTYFGNKVTLLDPADTPVPLGTASTVVDCTGAAPVILREGAISAAQIHAALRPAD